MNRAVAQDQSASTEAIGLSVIICSYNPRIDILARVMESLDKQTLSPDQYEVILIDNGSKPAIQLPQPTGGARRVPPIILNESRQGLSFARCRGINAARGKLMVFVDDDNFLAEDYLAQAMRIAAENPTIGLFGGISEGILERPVGKIKTPLLPYLGVRDYGTEPITSTEDCWGKWEPIGAGMCCRRDVAIGFAKAIERLPSAGSLGRRGGALLSGEDSLFARISCRLGYANSYQPALKLHHFIKKSRLKWSYFTQLIKGHGRSFVVLHRLLGEPIQSYGRIHCMLRLGYRLKTAGLPGAAMWYWDIGYRIESRQPFDAPQPPKDLLRELLTEDKQP